jgi:hypothetical protein
MSYSGIFTLEQFQEAERSGKLDHRRVSLKLLEMGEHPKEEQVRLFDTICVSLQFSNGTYRTTFRKRFHDLDTKVLPWIRKCFAPDAAITIEDRAASSCLTSAEWAAPLLQEFPKLRFLASDIMLFLVEATDAAGETFVLEPNGAMQQYIHPPHVLPLRVRESRKKILNHWKIARLKPRAQAISIPQEWSNRCTGEPEKSGSWTFRQISLLHPQAAQLERESAGRFRVELGSVFDRTPESCQVLRTVNILNTSYFPEQQLREGVEAARVSLVEGGIWIVGRTLSAPEFTNQMSILQKRQGRFELLERVHAGWEREDLALKAVQ